MIEHRVWRLLLSITLASSVWAALPIPPRQADPWTATVVDGIPAFVGETAKTLFDAGLADPRGGVYRHITVHRTPMPGVPAETVDTDAWVFEGGFAVCWDGMVHAVEQNLGPADLATDVAAGPIHPRLTNPTPRYSGVTAELGPSFEPLPLLLLLRLNELDLAGRLWQKSSGDGLLVPTERSFWPGIAANGWLSTAYDRAENAYLNGEYQLALDVFQSLASWRERMAPSLSQNSPGQIFASAAQLQPFVREAERRVNAKPNGPLDRAKLQAMPQDARIKELINRLEDVVPVQISIPGALDSISDPIDQLLIAEGEAAAMPLLDALQNDQRLTRSLYYSVKDAARRILIAILQPPADVRNAKPEELRAWWVVQGGKNLAERDFALLANDRATPAQWLEAATKLVVHTLAELAARGPNTPLPPRIGEALRSRTNPSVTELLDTRARGLAASKQDRACEMARLRYLWEPDTALPTLKAVAALPECRADNWVMLARVNAGDRTALSDWAAVMTATPSLAKAYPYGQPAAEVTYLPLWTFPDEPSFQDLSRRLFLDPSSSRYPLNLIRSAGTDIFAIRPRSALLVVPAFREGVLIALQTKEVIGSVERSSKGMLSVIVGQAGYGTSAPDDPTKVIPPEDRPLRMSDFAAWQLSQIDGFPAFPLDGPLADRDRASDTIAQFLRDHAADLRMQTQDTIMGILESPSPEFAVRTGVYLDRAGRGTIAGAVTDSNGAPIAGADIEIANMNTLITSKVVSSNTGRYSLADLPVGRYWVTVAVPGFKTWVYSNLLLEATQTLIVDAKLQADR